MNERILWVDNAKAIGIFLVVLGHLSHSDVLTNIIYSFHMPLFFFLSGMFFSDNNDFSRFVLKKSKSLLVPYFVFGVVTYLFWVLIGRKFGVDASLNIPWWRPLVGMLYSVGTDNWILHNTPLWFLTCLYLSEMIFFLLLRTTEKVFITIVIFSVVGYWFSLYDAPKLPWSLNTVPQAVLFLGAGFLAKKHIREPRYVIAVLIFSICVAGLFMVEPFNGRVDMNSSRYGNYFLFLASAIMGIVATIVLSQKINFSAVALIGQHTLVIFLLHGVAISLWKGVLVFGLGVNLAVFESSIAMNFLLAIAVIASLIPVSQMVIKLTPWAIGAKPNKRLQPTQRMAAE